MPMIPWWQFAIRESALSTFCLEAIRTTLHLFHLFFGRHLLVGAKLLIQVPVDLFLSEQRSKAACYISQKSHKLLVT